MALQIPENNSQSPLVANLLNSKTYNKSKLAKLAGKMKLTPEQTIRQILKKPLEFTKADRQSAVRMSKNIAKEKRKQNNKNAIIGKTRRM
jgi:adenylylsulfate kinase-like enzyme